jgi:hypothetical protein
VFEREIDPSDTLVQDLLQLDMLCELYQTLPSEGGILEQDQLLMRRLLIVRQQREEAKQKKRKKS